MPSRTVISTARGHGVATCHSSMVDALCRNGPGLGGFCNEHLERRQLRQQQLVHHRQLGPPFFPMPSNDGTADVIMQGTNRLTPNVDLNWGINSLPSIPTPARSSSTASNSPSATEASTTTAQRTDDSQQRCDEREPDLDGQHRVLFLHRHGELRRLSRPTLTFGGSFNTRDTAASSAQAASSKPVRGCSATKARRRTRTPD